MHRITSRNNEHLKYLRRVRDGKVSDRFFVEGRRLVRELTDSAVIVESFLISEELLPVDNELADSLRPEIAPLKVVSSELFKTVSQTKSPQGIAALCNIPANGIEAIEKSISGNTNNTIIFLTGVSNPGNLGSVIRTAEATGTAGVIVSRESANPFSPAAVRGSMGSILRVPVWRSAESGLVMSWAKERGFKTLCADPYAHAPFWEVDWARNILVVFGAEAQGLDEATLSSVDEAIRIPIAEQLDSLNLGVAAGIILYEASRRR